MKKIKRIFILLSVLLFSAFLLSCSKKEEESTSVSAEEASGLEGVISNYFQQIESQDDEQLEEREAKAKRYLEEKASAESAAARGYIDALIFPEETRQRVISALDMLYGKADFDFHKKFGSI